MTGHAASCQSLVNSMVVEGVFERFPKLKLVLTESGFAWVPSLAWRLDKIWKRLKTETPHLQRLPSEYIKQHIWFTTQPMDEPEKRKYLSDIIEWIGWDRLIFATDYPHWDWDDPNWALPIRPTEENRKSCSARTRGRFGVAENRRTAFNPPASPESAKRLSGVSTARA